MLCNFLMGLSFTKPQGSTGLEISVSSVRESAELDFPAGVEGVGRNHVEEQKLSGR